MALDFLNQHPLIVFIILILSLLLAFGLLKLF